MPKLRSVLTLAVLLLSSVPLCSLAGDDLYVDEADVVDEGVAARNAALSDMLKRVLIRVSGNTGVAGQPAARAVLDAAPSLVQEYRYRTEEGGDRVRRMLTARFDRASVDRMMRDNGLPVWADRPVVLLWLAGDRNGNRQMLNLESRPQERDAAKSKAAQRGMPLQLPLMDLEDQAALTAADLWSGYQAGIRNASVRYPVEAILSGRLSASRDAKWRGEWTLDSGGRVQQFQTPPQSMGEAIAFGLDQAQNLLAARFAPMPGAGGPSGTHIGFSGVDDLSAYGRLLAALSQAESIGSKALRYAGGDRVVFEVHAPDGAEQLVRALDASTDFVADLVAPVVDPGAESPVIAPRIDYAYRLIR